MCNSLLPNASYSGLSILLYRLSIYLKSFYLFLSFPRKFTSRSEVNWPRLDWSVTQSLFHNALRDNQNNGFRRRLLFKCLVWCVMAGSSSHCLPTCLLLFGKCIYPSRVRFLSIPRPLKRVAWAAVKWSVHQIGKFPFPVNTGKKNQIQLQTKPYMSTNSWSLYQRLHQGNRNQGGPPVEEGRDCAKVSVFASPSHTRVELIVACLAPLALRWYSIQAIENIYCVFKALKFFFLHKTSVSSAAGLSRLLSASSEIYFIQSNVYTVT